MLSFRLCHNLETKNTESASEIRSIVDRLLKSICNHITTFEICLNNIEIRSKRVIFNLSSVFISN